MLNIANMTYCKNCVAGLYFNILEHAALVTDARKSDNSLSLLHHNDSPVKKSDVFTEFSVAELQNSKPVPMVLPTPRRHFAFFLRTKSDGAIVDRVSNSSQLMSAADIRNKPLAVASKAESGTTQVENSMKNGQEIRDVTLKRRNFDSNSAEWPLLTQDTIRDKVVAKSVLTEYGHNVESSSSQQKVPKPDKSDDHELPTNGSPAPQSPAKLSDSFRLMPTTYWSGSCRFVGSTVKTSVASAVMMQEAPMAGQPNVNTPKITYCTAVPLSTSNIVNISRPCSVTGQNGTGIQRRVIVIKRRQNLPST